MTAFLRALQSFWARVTFGGNTLPAYLTGQVPINAPFPYIVYTAAHGGAFSGTYLTATVYGTGGNAQVAGILDAMAAMIPEGGAKLPFAGGMALLNRNSADFLTIFTDEDFDKTGVVAGRLSYQINFY